MYRFNENFYADVRIENRYTSEVRFKNGQLEECKEVEIKKAFLRVFDGEMWYYASTSAVDRIQEELDALYAYATPCKDILNHPIVKLFQVVFWQLSILSAWR